jgi:hypothetical protein
MIVFGSLHIGIVFFMTIGLFSFICIISWLALVPGSLWDRLGWGRAAADAGPVTKPSRIVWAGGLANAAGVAGIFFMLTWNVLNTVPNLISLPVYDPHQPETIVGYDEIDNPLYHAFEITGHALGIGQHFQMFGFPPTVDAWFVYRATLADGTVRDIFMPGRDLDDQQTLSGRDSLPNHQWRQLHWNLTSNLTAFARQRLAEYAAEQWNRSHPAEQQVRQLRVECYFDQIWPTTIPGEISGAIIWGTYPDGPTNPLDAMLKQSILGGESPAF